MAKNFVKCNKCGKNLIERLPSGILNFKFGRKRDSNESVVEILIQGNVKMKCLKTATTDESSCSHWTEIPLFPFGDILNIDKE